MISTNADMAAANAVTANVLATAMADNVMGPLPLLLFEDARHTHTQLPCYKPADAAAAWLVGLGIPCPAMEGTRRSDRLVMIDGYERPLIQ